MRSGAYNIPRFVNVLLRVMDSDEALYFERLMLAMEFEKQNMTTTHVVNKLLKYPEIKHKTASDDISAKMFLHQEED